MSTSPCVCGQKKGFVKDDVYPPLLFILITEAVWGFYEMMECQINLSNDCKVLALNPVELKNQILNIYLRGVLK